MTHIDPHLRQDVARFGADHLATCMNCGNCTAVCSLADESAVFPRKTIRHLQLGLKDELLRGPEPWLCYYCGECSSTCPREVDPGEIMMSTRRWLTAELDWTGLSRRLYLSKTWEVGMLAGIGLMVVVLFYFLHGPIVTDRVALNTFAPVAWIELGDWILAAGLGGLLLSNAFRMHRFIMGRDAGRRPPVSLYLSELKTFLTHAATQKQWRRCEGPTRWLRHFLLVSAYLTILILVVVFLRWFQTDEVRPFWHPTRLLGYYATAVLLFVTADAMTSRARKQEAIHQHSHLSDWMFLVLLFLTALTGILVHLFRIAGWPLSTYYSYVIHLAIAVAMLVVEVPFGKWAHLLYRPLAIYLNTVKTKMKNLPDHNLAEPLPT